MLDTNKEQKSPEEICGVIMPISTADGCSEQHWKDVKEIIFQAVTVANFTPELVCNSDEVGIIQSRIINNLYSNPIAICDVSAKNPNVMFELGMRLAFDKPTIIIKDDKTPYSFDTSPIQHLEYPRDLRYSTIVDFKQQLTEKIIATSKKFEEDPSYTTFLKNFGTFKVAKLASKEISKEDFILEELQVIKSMIYKNDRDHRNSVLRDNHFGGINDIVRTYVEDTISTSPGPIMSQEIYDTVSNKIMNRYNIKISKAQIEKTLAEIFPQSVS